ncbi:MAG: hypothetical protein JJ900_16850 [Rhodospirillales bacterium]|nr:hypothetical protein [Rhodospirillales bacterium]MBO6788518.1 hypothetical protein [Rhodospirillales bacterium]
MLGIIQAATSAFQWVKILELASGEAYAAALQKLETLPAQHVRQFEFSLLRGVLQLQTRRFALAKETFKALEARLPKLEKYSRADRAYFNAFLRLCIRDTLEALGEDASSYSRRDFRSVDLQKVTPGVRSNFPLRGHPDWDYNEDIG